MRNLAGSPSRERTERERDAAPLVADGDVVVPGLTVGVNLVVDWFLSIDARPSGAQAEM